MGGKRQKFPNIGWLVKLQSFKSKLNNFLNIHYFSKTCITEKAQTKPEYNEKALYSFLAK